MKVYLAGFAAFAIAALGFGIGQTLTRTELGIAAGVVCCWPMAWIFLEDYFETYYAESLFARVLRRLLNREKDDL